MKKATHQTARQSVTDFQQILNVGPSLADDFRRLGFKQPIELRGRDPWLLYRQIAALDGTVHDPCVLDCFISAIDFMDGNPPRKWWDYTAARKQKYGDRIDRLKTRFE
jgi:hypothetical protein